MMYCKHCSVLFLLSSLLFTCQVALSQDRSIDDSINSLKEVLKQQELTDEEKRLRAESRKGIREVRALDEKWAALAPLIAEPKSYNEAKTAALDAYRSKAYGDAINHLVSTQKAHNSFYSTALDIYARHQALGPNITQIKNLADNNAVNKSSIPALEQWEYITNKLGWGVYGTITLDEIIALPNEVEKTLSILVDLDTIHTQIDDRIQHISDDNAKAKYQTIKAQLTPLIEVENKINTYYKPLISSLPSN